jgi:tetraacyldisaccharide 4'-kinase
VRRDLAAVLTTEKDSVRFPHKPQQLDVPVYFLRVEISILNGHDVWDDLIKRICVPPPLMAQEPFF